MFYADESSVIFNLLLKIMLKEPFSFSYFEYKSS